MSGIEITPIAVAGANLVRRYGDGGFSVGPDIRHQGSAIVFKDGLHAWPPTAADAITLESLQPVTDSSSTIDILVLGCGQKFTAPPKGLRDALRDHGIVLEWMDTGAACRTFNVLLGEERRVAAAFIAVD